MKKRLLVLVLVALAVAGAAMVAGCDEKQERASIDFDVVVTDTGALYSLEVVNVRHGIPPFRFVLDRGTKRYRSVDGMFVLLEEGDYDVTVIDSDQRAATKRIVIE